MEIMSLQIDNVHQITNTSGCQNNSANISGDGNIIGFISDCDITGQNPSNLQQGFYYDALSGQITQITFITEKSVDIMKVSKDGSTLVIRSSANIDGNNPDLKDEIYSFDIGTSILTQITMSAEDSFRPTVNGDGSVIAFTSRADFTGQNPGGTIQIFTFDGAFHQITNLTMGSAHDLNLNEAGDKLAFASNQNITSQNPSNLIQVFIVDLGSNLFQQLTMSTFGSIFHTNISGDGKRVVFSSDGDPAGIPTNGSRQAFVYDADLGGIFQLTNLQGGMINEVDISCDGEMFGINYNPPDSNDTTLLLGYFNPPPRNVPTLSEWGLMAMAGLLGIVGFMVIRRRKVTA